MKKFIKYKLIENLLKLFQRIKRKYQEGLRGYCQVLGQQCQKEFQKKKNRK